MRKFSVILLGALLLSLTSLSAQRLPRYGKAGCGPMSDAFVPSALGGQIVVYILNFFGLAQGPSITTGTSNCGGDEVFRTISDLEKKQELFVHVNFSALEEEIVRGNGEHVMSLGRLMGCDAERLPLFSASLKNRYVQLFPVADTTPDDFLKNVKTLVREDRELSSSCKLKV